MLFSPAALIGAPVTWSEVDDSHARVTYTVGDQVVCAELAFNSEGDLVDFVSDERLRATADGKAFQPMRWHTPLTSYRKFGGRRVATGGEGKWYAPAPDGHHTYVDFSVDDIAHNPRPGPSAAEIPPASRRADAAR